MYFIYFFGVVLFYYFCTEMLCAGCDSRQCRTKSNAMEQFLCRFVNSMHDAQNRRILTSLLKGLTDLMVQTLC